MDNAVNTVDQGEQLDSSKRALILGLGAAAIATATGTASMAQEVLAADVSRSSTSPLGPIGGLSGDLSYRESELGIDYRALAPSPLAEMLSQGEAEWMANAVDDYEEDTSEAWSEELVPQIVTGAVSELTVDELRDYTPEMLLSFARLDGNDPKYGLLAVYGSSFLADRLLASA